MPARAMADMAAQTEDISAKLKDRPRVTADLGIRRSVARALTPSAPVSPTNKPVRSGPSQRKNGRPRAPPWAPVGSSSPRPVTTSRPITASAAEPHAAPPQNTLFCDSAPPTVARRPDSGPQYGVRRSCSASAAFSRSQVQPASTVTIISTGSISTIRSSRVRSSVMP